MKQTSIFLLAALLGLSCTKKQDESADSSAAGSASVLKLDTDLTGIADSRAVQDTISTLPAGLCVPMKLDLLDSSGAAAILAQDLAVSLTHNMSTSPLYGNSDCSGAPIDSLSVPSGTSSVSFYVKYAGIESGSDSIVATPGASDPALSAVQKDLSLVGGAADHFLIFSYGFDLYINAGCPAFGFNQVAIGVMDAYGNATAPSADVTVNLGLSGTGSAVYDDNCAPISHVTLTPSAPAVTVTLKATSSGTKSLTTSDASGALTPRSENLGFVQAPGGSMLVTAAATATNGSCKLVSVQVQDYFGNNSSLQAPTRVVFQDAVHDSAPTASNSGNFYVGDATCSNILNEVIGIDLNQGDSSFTFYYKPAVAQDTDLVLTDVNNYMLPQTHEMNVTP